MYLVFAVRFCEAKQLCYCRGRGMPSIVKGPCVPPVDLVNDVSAVREACDLNSAFPFICLTNFPKNLLTDIFGMTSASFNESVNVTILCLSILIFSAGLKGWPEISFGTWAGIISWPFAF